MPICRFSTRVSFSPAILVLVLSLLIPLAPSFAEEAETATLDVDEWLVLAPSTVAQTAFREAEAPAGDLLDELTLAQDDLWPAAGRAAHWPPGETIAWQTRKAPISFAEGGTAAAWLAVTLETGRFLDAKLEIESAGLLKVWVDGSEAASKKEADEPRSEETGSQETGSASATLALDTGSHRLLVLAVRPDGVDEWTLEATLEAAPELIEAVSFSTGAERPVAIDDLLEPTRAQRVDVSPDGAWIAVEMQRPAAPREGGESWIEILSPAGETVRLLRDEPAHFSWSPAADDSFAYVAAGQVRLGSVKSGAENVIARDLDERFDGVEGLRFATERTLILSSGESPEADERGVKRYRDPMDRWSYRRHRQHHHLLGIDGSMRRLTVSDPFDELQDIHPEGDRLMLARAHYAGDRRPFRRTELLELDLGTLAARTIADLGWFGSARYSPDGEHALVLGSAALFGGAGSTLEEGRIVNDYDNQAYLLDLESGEAKALSRDFDPSIVEALWPEGGNVYLRVEDKSWERLAALDPSSLDYETLPTGVDIVHDFDVEGSRLAWIGSSVNRPHAVFTRELGAAEPQLLLETSGERFADVRFGEVRDWSFTSKAGDEILGRVYLPPGLDEESTEAGRYPAIVYYYGGTSPVGRAFGGRYPKELWAAQGYVVYVLQPSGTTGFGQEFAARHVNAWGRQTADEILEGTELFLEAHPFVDPERVGAIGASYGGFMTMYLQTRSDIYAAAVSHAGISNLASYWGKGWWGYLYSDAASAGSFPWNNPDLYVGQSPLYAADKIQTPLLLLHGDADTNVPPVESHQMYTALEVLGKEVELIEIGGQNHTIRSFEERRLWTRTILAFFDRYLKEEPEMWQHLWGSDEKPKG